MNRADNQSEFYYIEVKPKTEYKTFRTLHDAADGNGDIQRVVGQREDGVWETVKWLVGKKSAHIKNGRLVANDLSVENLFDRLNFEPKHIEANLFEAKEAGSELLNPNLLVVSVPDHPLIIELTPTAAPAETISNGVYRLTAECSGKTLDVAGAALNIGADVVQWTPNNGANQQWRVEQLSDGYYRLSAAHSGKALDAWQAAVSNGTKIVQYDWLGGSNQQWRIVPVGNGYYKLQPRHAPGKALDVSGASSADGAKIQLWDNNETAAQRWRFELAN